MRFRGLNLNLLVSLQALLEENSVTAAAKKVHLTQSAMSGSLARLREHFDDPLLEVAGRRMVKSPFAETLLEPLREALEQVDRIASSTASFNPAVSNRRFSLIISDYMVDILMPYAMPVIERTAPSVSLDCQLPSFLPGSQLTLGNIDLIMSPAGYVAQPCVSEAFCEEDYVIVGWSGNQAMKPRLDRDDIETARYIGVSFPGNDDEASGTLSSVHPQAALTKAGCQLNIVLAVPTFASAVRAVVNTSLVAIVHRRHARILANSAFHRVCEIAFPIEPLRETLVHHPLRSRDPGLIWLKQLLRDALADADVAASSALGVPPTMP